MIRPLPAVLYLVASLALLGAWAGRGLAAGLMRLARAEGCPPTPYWAPGGGSRWAAIPLLGHLFRPRSARCVRQLLLELGGAAALALPPLLFPAPQAAATALFLFALLGATLIDFDHMIIPDLFTVGLAVAGLVLSALVPQLHGLGPLTAWSGLRSAAAAGLGLAIGSAFLLWFSLIGEMVLGREVLGFGDVKLAGAIGAFCGWQGAVFSVFAGAALGGFALAAAFLLRLVPGVGATGFRGAPASAERNARLVWGAPFPFGPMLAAAAVLYAVALHPMVDRYLAQYLALF